MDVLSGWGSAASDAAGGLVRRMGGSRDKNNQALLICRNVTVNTRRTSLRMEPLLWESLREIADREGMTLNQLCSEIDGRRGPANLTAAIRVFIISYYRNAAMHSGGGGSLREEGARSPHLERALEEAIPLDGD